MSELYLIAHKVRGEAAFDVAIKMGDWWIIPTSGHRAYPWAYFDIDAEMYAAGPMPTDLPDHYPGAKAPTNLDDLEID